jgi:outer membrane protein W
MQSDDVELQPLFASALGVDTIPTNGGFGVGAAAGLDLSLAEHWALGMGLEYKSAAIEIEDADATGFDIDQTSVEMNVDPLVVHFGLAYSF